MDKKEKKIMHYVLILSFLKVARKGLGRYDDGRTEETLLLTKNVVYMR